MEIFPEEIKQYNSINTNRKAALNLLIQFNEYSKFKKNILGQLLLLGVRSQLAVENTAK